MKRKECSHFEAVKWNPYNGVVQCHVCGHVYVPSEHEGDWLPIPGNKSHQKIFERFAESMVK